MNLDLISRVVQGSAYLPPGPHVAGRALSLVPALADALPEVALPSGGRPPQFPVVCSDLLSGAVERALRMAVDDALADIRAPELAELTERLREDPLARGLRRLIQEGASLSPGAACVVALDFARLCSQTLSNPGPHLREQVAALAALPPERRGPVLARIAAPMQARLALAANDMAAGGLRPPALLSALAANPLVFLFAKGTFGQDVDLAFLASVTGAPIDADMARDAVICFDTAVSETLGRIEARKATPADLVFALRFNLAELISNGGNAAAVLRAEPDAWAHLLPQLAHSVSAGALVDAGAQQARAVELCRPEVGAAVAATMRKTLRALQVWEVLAAFVTCVNPAGEATIERQLLVPRAGAAVATIVAVSTGMMRSAVSEPVALSREVAEAVFAWRANLGNSAIVSDDGSVALFAFSDVMRGVSFALSLRERPAAGLPVPAVSVATGTVGGGTDGAAVRLSGPAVQDALRLLAHAPLDMRPPDAPILSQLGLIDGTLRGTGVAVHTSALDALRSKRLRKVGRGRPSWANEAWEDELGVLALITINGLSDGLELARCGPADWEALCAAGDAPAVTTPAPPRKKGTSATPAAAAPKPPEPAPPPRAAEPAPAPVAPAPPPTSSRDDLARTAPRPIVSMPDRDADDEEPPRPAPAAVPVAAPPPVAMVPPAPPAPPEAEEAPARSSSHEVRRPTRHAAPPPPEAVVAAAVDAPAELVMPEPPPSPAEPEAPPLGAAFIFESDGSDPFSQESAPLPVATSPPTPAGGDPFLSDPFAAAPVAAPAATAAAAPAGDPFAHGDPFAAVASPPPQPTPTATAPSPVAPASDAFASASSGGFDAIFGVPVGDAAAPPPSAPPPAIGAMGFVVDDAPPVPAAQIDAPGQGFSLPVFEGAADGNAPIVSATAPEPRKQKKSPVVDFDFLLRGYACYVERGRVAFGRPYGTRLVDLHVYDTGGDLERAYQQFMEAKIREGFIPQTELTGDLPRTVTVMPLDPDRLAVAWRVLT